MFRSAAAAVCIAFALALLSCSDDVPAAQDVQPSAPQPQAIEIQEEVDDSLCTLLNPLFTRRLVSASYVAVEDAIDQGAAINARCADGISPLHHAAAGDSLEVVELLLEHDADVHAVNSAGETPLIYAIGAVGGLDTNSASLRALLDAGADVDARKELGQTALQVAALAGKANALATLLEYEPELEAADNAGHSALHYAAFYTATAEPTRLLLEAGLDPNAAAGDRTTPLHFAADSGSAEVTRLLLEAGADVHRVDGAGLNPLHHAAPEGGAALIRVLLEHGADPNVPDPDGRTALHIAARQNPLSAVAELLLNAGASTSVQDRHGNTACDLLSRHLSDTEVRDRICERD